MFIAGFRLQLLNPAPPPPPGGGVGGEIKLNPGNPCQFYTLDVDRSTSFEFKKFKTYRFYWNAISQLFETEGGYWMSLFHNEISTANSNQVPSICGFRASSCKRHLIRTNIFINLAFFFPLNSRVLSLLIYFLLYLSHSTWRPSFFVPFPSYSYSYLYFKVFVRGKIQELSSY
jgi:hypothetical protein